MENELFQYDVIAPCREIYKRPAIVSRSDGGKNVESMKTKNG
jgi:hypothetical protein